MTVDTVAENLANLPDLYLRAQEEVAALSSTDVKEKCMEILAMAS